MKAYDLLDAVNSIPAELVHKAETAGINKRTIRMRRIRRILLASAACLALALMGLVLFAPVQKKLLWLSASLGYQPAYAVYTQIPVGTRIAEYEAIAGKYHDDAFPAEEHDISKRIQSFVGEVFLTENTNIWHRVKGMTELKYLIRRDSDGSLSLWEFRSFLVLNGSDRTGYDKADQKDWEARIRASFPDADLTPYTYGEMLLTIYGIGSAADIASVTVAANTAYNDPMGQQVQKEVGTKTLKDSETIEALYRVLNASVCCGQVYQSLYLRNTDRFSYSFSTVQTDKISSGEAARGSRILTLTLADGTSFDRLFYNALNGALYENGGIEGEYLSEEQVRQLNEIIGIR